MKEVKDIVFLTLTLGWKNENRPSGPTELDLDLDLLFIVEMFWDTVDTECITVNGIFT